jgi:hypothetical protein
MVANPGYESEPEGDPRSHRIRRLVEEFDVLAVAERAAADAGIPERGQAVVYCLVALVEKAASGRGPTRKRYGLLVDTSSFSGELESAAAVITQHIVEWG